VSAPPNRSAPRVLILAGHDPSAGAGLHADLEACDAAGARAVLVPTAWTEQDGSRVWALRSRGAGWVLGEALAAMVDPIDALKTGLLADAAAIEIVAQLVQRLGASGRGAPRVVVDPVLAASGGEPFLDANGTRALLERLVPLGIVLTPNLDELAGLSGVDRRALDEGLGARVEAARRLLELGASAIVVKGGHGTESPIVDLLVEPQGLHAIEGGARHPGRRMHGSGCRHASFLAARWALHGHLERAAREAQAWMGRRFGAGG
jgi:hydroxymethylpyrimidine/phosphomethylpyrimidine kinase